MKQTKLYANSRYAPVPKLYYEDVGHMVMPVCPEFKKLYSYQVTATDTIDGLAKRFYGDSKFQWVLLVANDSLTFPPILQAGLTLLVPDRLEVMSYVRGQDYGL